MAERKTVETDASVEDFLGAIGNEIQREAPVSSRG